MHHVIPLSIALLTIATSAMAADSAHFRLDGGIRNGGVVTGASPDFAIRAHGDTAAGNATSDTFLLRHDTPATLPTPDAPTLTNTAATYDRLKMVLTTPSSGIPSDTVYAVAVSRDLWKTYQWIGDGDVPVADAATATWRTYDDWGGSTGTTLLGLTPGWGYQARIAARVGTTVSAWSMPSATAKTSVPSIRLTLTRNVTDFFILNAARVAQVTATDVRVTTNTENGYKVYLRGTGNGIDGGLADHATGSVIPSFDGIIGPGNPGYGAQASSATAIIDDRYAHDGNTVGAITPTNVTLASKKGIATDESTLVTLKVAIDGSTPAGHYTDTIYYTATPLL